MAAGKMTTACNYHQPVTAHIDQLVTPIAPYPKIYIEHQTVKACNVKCISEEIMLLSEEYK